MSETKEAEQSTEDKTESMTNEPVATKETDKGNENADTKETDIGSEHAATKETDLGSKDIAADVGGKKCLEDKQEIAQENENEDEDEEEDKETGGSGEDDAEHETTLQPNSIKVSDDGRKELRKEVYHEKKFDADKASPVDVAQNGNNVQMENVVASENNGDTHVSEASLKNDVGEDYKSPANDDEVSTREDKDDEVKLDVCDSINHQSGDNGTISKISVQVTPNTPSSPLKVEITKEEPKNEAKDEEGPLDAESKKPSNLCIFDTDTIGVGESGTEDEQSAFIMELIKFHKERGLDFRPPKFYGGKLNLLKLWRAVMKLGGYDKVTACKYWRQVGESFKPPKTCTTVSWTFRIFYEKALLDYERYRTSTDGSGLSFSMGSESQGPGSGRTIRDAAARAMQGWHSQRVLDNGEVSNPIVKDKNPVSLNKKEKPLKSLGNFLKRKKPSSTDSSVKAVPMKLPKTQSDATVIDIGSPADWVKINVRVTRDCYEVYALVPGLLREEVRVQSDPAGRLVISGEPENPDNPWNVTPFKKVVSLPSRIDPHQTSAVVTLHGQLFVRVPFEQYD